MNQVLKIVPFEPSENESVVSILDEMLSKAKAGDLTSLIVTGSTRGGGREIHISEGADNLQLLGLLERTKHLILELLDRDD